MGWWQDARRGAAYEYGARHYRGFAALEAAGWLLRRLWLLLVLAVLASAGWAAWHWYAKWAGLTLPLVLLAGLAVLGALTAAILSGMSMRLRLYSSMANPARAIWLAVMAAGVAAAAVAWMALS